MCGIVGFTGRQNATPIILEGLKKLEYRGYDSAGVAIETGEGIRISKTKGRLAALEEKLAHSPVSGSCGIGHTRWATHGAPSDVNAHPHFNAAHNIAVVHNGIIENYLSIREELSSAGTVFLSETDTEVLAHLVDHYFARCGDLADAVAKTMARVEGSYAMGVLCDRCPGTIVAARKDSPLIIGLGEGGNFIASDIPAVLPHTREVYLLEDQELAVITPDSVAIRTMDGSPVQKDIFHVTWDVAAAEKGGYAHFMLKEIFEQPRVVRDTLSPRLPQSGGIVLDTFKLDAQALSQIDKIHIVACGTAYYAGCIGKALIERLARIPVMAEIASEFRYKEPLLDERTLVILLSQSGETADTMAALRLSKRRGARVLAVVNAVGSSIAREAHDVLYTWAGPEIAVASTKAYSTQVVVMQLLAVHIARTLKRMSDADYDAFAAQMRRLPRMLARTLELDARIQALAEKYQRAKNVFYIGRGLDFTTALEGSLKLKEIAYIHSEPYAAGELKHGPIAMIEQTTLVVGVLTQEALFEKTVSNLREVKARGARVLAIAQQGNTEIEKTADDVIYIPRTHWMVAPILANIPQQLFAYHIAVALGNDVDKPRNLAKSVTVE